MSALSGITRPVVVAVALRPVSRTARQRRCSGGPPLDKCPTRLEKEPRLRATSRTLALSCHVSSDEPVIWSIVESARRTVVSGLDQTRGDEPAARRSWVRLKSSHGSASQPTRERTSSSLPGSPLRRSSRGSSHVPGTSAFGPAWPSISAARLLNFRANFMRCGTRSARSWANRSCRKAFIRRGGRPVGNDDTVTWIRRSIGTGWLPRRCAAA